MSWLWTILGIMALIVLHELGHFAVAKAVGMRVERFALFFPPLLLRVKRGETEYAIGAIPAGGYVKITGMSPEEIGQLDPEVARRAYYNQAPWKRIAVILAGPAVNIAIAFALFWAVVVSGDLNGNETLANLVPSQTLVRADTSVQAIEQGAPAAAALRRGDRIVSVDGLRATRETAISSQIGTHRCAGVQRQGCSAAMPVVLGVRRAGRLVDVTVYPRYDATAKRMLVGFDFGAEVAPHGALGAVGVALGAMWSTTTETVGNLGRALTESKVRHQISSIIGISRDANASVQAGAGKALVFLGFFSLVLAVINLFPFLPLDGGHVLWSLAEKVRGKRISMLTMYRFSSVGIVLMLFLVINGISNDISRLGV